MTRVNLRLAKSAMRSRERGQVLILFVVALVSMLGLVALVVDTALFYEVRRELQNAADAGAEAGVSKLTNVNSPNPAITMAQTYAKANYGVIAKGLCDQAAPTAVTASAAFALQSGGSVNELTVKVSCSVGYVFGQAINLTVMNISASATAALGSLVTDECAVPIGMEEQPGSTGASNDFGWKIGTQLDIAIQTNATWLCLDASCDLGTYIDRSNCQPVTIGTNVTTDKKAAKVGHVVDAFATRFNTSKSGNNVPCPDGSDPRVGNTLTNVPPTVNSAWTVIRFSNCVAAIPIIKAGDLNSGTAQVVGFALFYISEYNGPKTVSGYFLGPTVAGSLGAYDSKAQPMIRLVR